MIAKTLAGLENVLEEELKSLGAENISMRKRAVEFDGDMAIMYKANLWCRTALSILRPLHEFTFEGQQQYYDILREFAWDEVFRVDNTIAINAIAFQSEFPNTHFLAQRTKDAIADYFTEKTGKRPNVDLEDPQIKINIYIQNDRCSVSLDSSGAPLFKRGYRRKNVMAPLNEVLGAGLVLLSGWDKKEPFYDPMCGSGTFSIEAAMIALNMAPALFRRNFSFLHWQDFDAVLWESLKEEAQKARLNHTPEIFASDINNNSMDAVRQNLMEAGLLGKVKLEKKDFFAAKPAHSKGLVILNPPYGRRLQSDDIGDYYQKIGTALKHLYTGFKACIISPDRSLTHRIGLRHSSQQMVFNGQIECRYLCYELYEGSKKEKDPTGPRERKQGKSWEKSSFKRASDGKSDKKDRGYPKKGRGDEKKDHSSTDNREKSERRDKPFKNKPFKGKGDGFFRKNKGGRTDK